MRRPVKLNFKPLSLKETAERLGIPPKRAVQIIAMFGADPKSLRTLRKKNKTAARKTFSRSAKASR
jgi:hypothetical protein